MRQLLIVAIDTEEPIDLAYTAIEVAMADIRIARAEIITEPTGSKQAADAAKRCMDGLLDGTNITVGPPMTEREKVAHGMKALGAWLDRDRMARSGWAAYREAIGRGLNPTMPG